jgi:hypothetical protein
MIEDPDRRLYNPVVVYWWKCGRIDHESFAMYLYMHKICLHTLLLIPCRSNCREECLVEVGPMNQSLKIQQRRFNIKMWLARNNNFVKKLVLDFSESVSYGFCNALNVGCTFGRYSVVANKRVFRKKPLIIKMVWIVYWKVSLK